MWGRLGWRIIELHCRRALPTIVVAVNSSAEGGNVERDKEGIHCFVGHRNDKIGGEHPNIVADEDEVERRRRPLEIEMDQRDICIIAEESDRRF